MLWHNRKKSNRLRPIFVSAFATIFRKCFPPARSNTNTVLLATRCAAVSEAWLSARTAEFRCALSAALNVAANHSAGAATTITSQRHACGNPPKQSAQRWMIRTLHSELRPDKKQFRLNDPAKKVVMGEGPSRQDRSTGRGRTAMASIRPVETRVKTTYANVSRTLVTGVVARRHWDLSFGGLRAGGPS